jgi:hypothetical protein
LKDVSDRWLQASVTRRESELFLVAEVWVLRNKQPWRASRRCPGGCVWWIQPGRGPDHGVTTWQQPGPDSSLLVDCHLLGCRDAKRTIASAGNERLQAEPANFVG